MIRRTPFVVVAALLALASAIACGQKPPPRVCDPDVPPPHASKAAAFGFCPADMPHAPARIDEDAGVDASPSASGWTAPDPRATTPP